MSSTPPSGTQRAIRWHPPSFDIRVETVDIPEIKDPDDVIVRVTLAALCGSDLHVYRGHADCTEVHTCGHEFIGHVAALGTNYHPSAAGRPPLYATLQIGDKVISPFTVSCGECHFCRAGLTCRCPHGALFGSPALAGGQAQYVRVPKGGGTLVSLARPDAWAPAASDAASAALRAGIPDAALLLLADVIPTGVFAALQALSHPKVLPMAAGRPWPLALLPPDYGATRQSAGTALWPEDAVLTFAVVGLGPVGVCACVSLLDMLAARSLPSRIVAIDPAAPRRAKMARVYAAIGGGGQGAAEFAVLGADEAEAYVRESTGGVGCAAVLEAVGSTSALALAYALVRPFGAIVSVGVHRAAPLPFTGAALYDKNASLDFGRCPARALLPLALELLARRQDVFGGVGGDASLVDRVVGFERAAEMYGVFERGGCGKVVFDPWR